MSAQFGRWNFDGRPIPPDYVEKVGATLSPYGPDSSGSYANPGLTILHRGFHTTKESHLEKQPYLSPSGAVLTWDGRLDNRKELICKLYRSLSPTPTDVEIVAAAYERWREGCLARLVGDWALAIWNPADRSLLLARDPIGTKHLYYSFDNNQVTWSTLLDPIVLFAGKTFEICEEYVAGWFAFNASAYLTPYTRIQTVPPSSFVRLQPGKHGVNHVVRKYWDFDPSKTVRYRTDVEYAQHFRALLTAAVRRRLRCDRPVLAELSGGLDSSSIVCIADAVLARGEADCPRLDTISWYDDSYDHLEPQSNELRWIAKVEEKRGRTGCHINLRESGRRKAPSRKVFGAEFDGPFAATPVPRVSDPADQVFQCYASHMRSQGYRVTLSGIGGGEFTGGFIPDPTVELQNLLSRARFFRLVHQLNAWSAKMRKPRRPILSQAIRGFFSTGPIEDGDMRSIPWLRPAFVRRNQAPLRCYIPSRVKFFGPLPSFQDNLARLEIMRRLVAGYCLIPELLREVRFPFLDRDLLEFLFAIPREQVVGLGKRRFVMRNALVGVIPDEVLNRRPKEFIPPEAAKDSSAAEEPRWPELGPPVLCSSIGMVDETQLLAALKKARHKEEVNAAGLERSLFLESWLRHLAAQGIISGSKTPQRSAQLRLQERSQEPTFVPVHQQQTRTTSAPLH